MRLLDTTTYKLHNVGSQEVKAQPAYAILSHRWQHPEVTFSTLHTTELSEPPRQGSPQFQQIHKIRGACATAAAQGLKWLWIDTCCIDKSNAVEESASINSMFEWYFHAAVCYGYLADVGQGQADVEDSVWLTRGWTLQELLAPKHMEFYDAQWRPLGTRQQLSATLAKATGIPEIYLNGTENFKTAALGVRLGWMAGRTTERVEDIAYSLLGVVGAFMQPMYGEGAQAFLRLQKTLLESPEGRDESIFAWTTPASGLLECYKRQGHSAPQWSHESWGLLAPSPDCFQNDTNLKFSDAWATTRPGGGCKITQQGVQFGITPQFLGETTNFLGRARSKVTFTLNCWRREQDKGKPVAIQLQLVRRGGVYSRVMLDELSEKRGAKVAPVHSSGVDLTISMVVEQPKLDLMV